MAPLMLSLVAMRWRALFIVGSLVASLGSPGGPDGASRPALAASGPPVGATSQPRFIREAQRALGELGYRPGPIDGVVGRKTQEALARYQRAQKIPVTGYLDAETMVRLDIHERVSRPAARLESEISRSPVEPTARATP
jgi:peptidoglycan hydrolase-like protein with peptidoglycan-binding domain